MNCLQVSSCWPTGKIHRASISLPQSSCLCASSSYALPVHSLRCYKAPSRLVYCSQNYNRSPVCLFGGKGEQKKDNDVSPWKSLEKAMGNLGRERSIQDILREQIQEQDFDGGGGSGRPPSGDGGDGSGNSEDEGFAGIVDEFIQVILATIGFIFVYIYMIGGEELSRLAKDYIKYLFGAKTSVRLRRALHVWRRFWRAMTRKKVKREDWLEREIIATPTTWHNPRQLARLVLSESFDD